MTGSKFVGIVLIVGLAIWTWHMLTDPTRNHPAPQVIGLGSAFEGNLQLPQAIIKVAFETARSHMFSLNSVGTTLRRVSDVGAWLSFAATATITLIAGFYGRAPAADGGAPNSNGLPARCVRLIAFLAALSAILTATSNLAVNKSQENYKRAEEVRDAIVNARKQVVDASDAAGAQAVLDDLVLKSTR